MGTVVEFIDQWLHQGVCINDTGKDLIICIDGQPGKLAPGQQSPASVDCDGIIHDDASATKIYGRSGIKEHKDPSWVHENWPRCWDFAWRNTEEGRDARPPGRNDRYFSRSTIFGVNVGSLTLSIVPSVHDLVAAKTPIAALKLSDFIAIIKQLERGGELHKLKDYRLSGEEFRIFLPIDAITGIENMLSPK
ncbi:MAG: hypothetical protein ACK59G_02375 [Cyanobacteriota bacterium]|jgi:hypothetical protein